MKASDSVWCVIPVYNNSATIRSVVLGCKRILRNVLVVDDGSTDGDVLELVAGTGITVLQHHKNKGKGKAILTALDYVSKQNARYMITLDGDGQHQPSDLEKFFPLLEEDSHSVIIGCRDFTRPNIPGKSRFGRSFANFWLRIETGVHVGDCQSGFRAYPVEHFKNLKLSGSYYDFETEALARAVWAGLKLKTVEIDVYYPPAEERVSSFRPFLDNFRISMMHTKLVARHLLPVPHRRLVPKEETKTDWNLFFHPLKFMKKLLNENATPGGLAASAFVGIVLAVLPLLFIHTVSILYVTARLHLNKIMAVSIQNLCNPPFVPFLCIELGHRMRYGVWLTSVSKEAFLGQVPELLWDWLLGSLVLAPVLAGLISAVVYLLSKKMQGKKEEAPVLCG